MGKNKKNKNFNENVDNFEDKKDETIEETKEETIEEPVLEKEEVHNEVEEVKEEKKKEEPTFTEDVKEVEIESKTNYLAIIIPVLCVAVVALIAFIVIKMKNDSKGVVDSLDLKDNEDDLPLIVPQTADPLNPELGENDTEYQYIDNFTSLGVFDNLSFIIDNTIGQHKENDINNLEEALSINGNILRNDRYNVEFAFQYGHYKNYANYLGESFTNKMDGYSLTKDDFKKVYKKVYGIEADYLGDNFYEDGYYNSSIYSNYVDVDGYRFVEVSSETDENKLTKVTAKVYDTIRQCEEENSEEDYCNTHGKKIGSIVIEYMTHAGTFVFKSISLFEE